MLIITIFDYLYSDYIDEMYVIVSFLVDAILLLVLVRLFIHLVNLILTVGIFLLHTFFLFRSYSTWSTYDCSLPRDRMHSWVFIPLKSALSMHHCMVRCWLRFCFYFIVQVYLLCLHSSNSWFRIHTRQKTLKTYM